MGWLNGIFSARELHICIISTQTYLDKTGLGKFGNGEEGKAKVKTEEEDEKRNC
jgi:hypothetical protein